MSKRSLATIALVCGTLAAMGGSGAQASVIYDNGPPGTSDGYNFYYGGSADAFVLPQADVVDGVNFWGYSTAIGGADLASIGWGIFSDASGAPGLLLDTGVATATPVDTSTTISGYPDFKIYDVRFSLPSIGLSAGTYWLALNSGPLGSSEGFYDCAFDGIGYCESGWIFTDALNPLGQYAVDGYGPANSPGPDWGVFAPFGNAFQILVPEPSTLALFCMALLALGGLSLRRKSA